MDERAASPEPEPQPGPESTAVEREPGPVADVPVVGWTAPGLSRKRLVPGARGLIYAGVLPRAVAWIADVIVIGIVSLVVLGVLVAIIVGAPVEQDPAVSAIVWLGIAVIAAVYFIAFWTGPRRATVGMRMLRLRVGFVATGEPLSVRQAVLRVVAMGIPLWPLVAIPAIGIVGGLAILAWPIVLLVSTARSPRRRGLHDRLAWSAVVMPGGTAPSP